MTGETGAAGLAVVEGEVRCPCCDSMAGRAVVRRQEMASGFSGCRRMAIVVAGDACRGRLAMIK